MTKLDVLERIKSELPGENAHFDMSPLYRMKSSDAIILNPNHRKSAVAVVLTHFNNEIHLILTQRPEYDGKHSGQISFPGGKVDDSDMNFEFTARRETQEEIGLKPNFLKKLTEMTMVFIPVSNFAMYPFLFWCDDISDLKPDPREVAEIILVKLTDLFEEENISTTEIILPDGTKRAKIPCFVLENKIIWGATALVLNELRLLIKN